MSDTLRVLLLEDSHADSEMIQRLLMKSGRSYDFRVVMTREAYVQALNEYQPDVILSDNAMPQFSATEALEILLERKLNIPFILVTGTVSEEFAAGIMKAGADDYILKDRLTRLTGAIEAALRQKQSAIEKEAVIQQLKASEEKYRVLVEEASEGIFISDHNFRFLSANASACKISQYSEAELLQMSVYDFFVVEDIARNPLQLEALKQGNTVVTERVMKRKDGKLVYLEISAKLLTIGRFLFLIRDVEERRMAQDALAASEEKYRTLIEQASDGIFIADNSGKFIIVNNSACKLSGYSASELSELSIYNLVQPESLAELPFNFEEMIRPQGARSERKMIHKNGSLVDIEISAKFLNDMRFIAFVRDISERKKAEKSILLSNERYNLVSKATNDSIWDLNVITGLMSHTGDGFKTLFGYDPDTTGTQVLEWQNLIHEEDMAGVLESQKQAFDNPEAYYWEKEYRFLKASARYAFVYDKGYIIRDENHRAVRMIGATQDITKLKEHEIHLLELNENLESQARALRESNAELEQFAYVASHDLQEPLRMVTSFLTLINKKYEQALDADGKKFIGFAVDGAKRMRQIIVDLLEFSRVGQNTESLVELDMNKLVNETGRMFQKDVHAKRALIEAGNLPVIISFETPVRQVFQNLIGNALKYSRENMPVEIYIHAIEQKDHWLFSVKDNGIGIETEYYEKIFIIFQRLHNKNEYSGTGLGLAITKKIIEHLGGKIWLESEPGKGSTFYFTLRK